MEREEKTREAFLKRRFGQMPEERERVAKFNAEQNDWTARCRICGEVLTGTLKEMKAHKHGEQGKPEPRTPSEDRSADNRDPGSV